MYYVEMLNSDGFYISGVECDSKRDAWTLVKDFCSFKSNAGNEVVVYHDGAQCYFTKVGA